MLSLLPDTALCTPWPGELLTPQGSSQKEPPDLPPQAESGPPLGFTEPQVPLP